MPPPSCTADDLELYVHLKYKGKPLFSTIVCDEFLNTLVTEGSIGFYLTEPAVLGKAEWEQFSAKDISDYEKGTLEKPLEALWDGLDAEEFDISIHMFRYSDSTMACVLRPSPEDTNLWDDGIMVHPKPGKTLTPQTEFDLSREQEPSTISFGDRYFPEHPPLKRSSLANEIKRRLPDPVFFSFYCDIGVVDGGMFAITGFDIEMLKLEGTVEQSEIDNFDCRKEEATHGVTLLHILSEIQGTSVPAKRKKKKVKNSDSTLSTKPPPKKMKATK